MIERPLVSIIIPFLNPGYWLSEAIESVVVQTYTHWEIILIDDGSIEMDTRQAQAYVKRFPEKIFYYTHEGHVNRGVTSSRNHGVQKSVGEFIAFLDADDCWMPSKLERQLTLFKSMPAVQMICEASLFWYSWADDAKEDYVQLIGADAGIYNCPTLIPVLYPFGEGQPPCPSGIIIKREALSRSGGFEESFSGSFQLYEDQAFLFKIYCSEIVYISDQVNNRYRKSEYSMSSAANDPGIYTSVRNYFADWAGNYLSKKPGHAVIIDVYLQEFKSKLSHRSTNQE